MGALREGLCCMISSVRVKFNPLNLIIKIHKGWLLINQVVTVLRGTVVCDSTNNSHQQESFGCKLLGIKYVRNFSLFPIRASEPNYHWQI